MSPWLEHFVQALPKYMMGFVILVLLDCSTSFEQRTCLLNRWRAGNITGVHVLGWNLACMGDLVEKVEVTDELPLCARVCLSQAGNQLFQCVIHVQERREILLVMGRMTGAFTWPSCFSILECQPNLSLREQPLLPMLDVFGAD